MATNTEKCPCGSSRDYAECCKPVIKDVSAAVTAEQLMRARYSAYVMHEIDFLIDSCQSEKSENVGTKNDKSIDRESTSKWSKDSMWQGLKILRTEKGQQNDREGIVEFTADYSINGLHETHHESAQFARTPANTWIYVSGEVKPTTRKREGEKIGRNDPCPCGSGKKHKKCCGK
ncbi:MAG: YchJ family protein [Treponemataceae bacterium]|nr:MAG: YchJ family protein [Treponemataceae bacterium]